MKLLIVTQKIDKNDPILGFFHRWIEEFANHWESIEVICLYKGTYSLPENVKVHSLGKEKGESRIKYIFNFYKNIFALRNKYDGVFVHMNQEYILLGGLLWRIFGKNIYMWRNHHSGSILTDIAAFFCKRVFCTSKFSYTAKYKKTQFMPVGVDIVNFKPGSTVDRKPQSVLFLARISSSKKPDLFIKVVSEAQKKYPNIQANIYGDALPVDRGYYDGLKRLVNELGADDFIFFNRGIPNTETVKVYSAHDIFINLSSSGMYDKTIFEAMACGCLVLASNDNLRGQIDDGFIFKQGDKGELIEKLSKILNYSIEEKKHASEQLQTFAKQHSLNHLSERLFNEINK